MTEQIKFYHSNLVDALYYFEYHGPLYKHIKWIERDKSVVDLYKVIKDVKISKIKFFLPWVRNIAVTNEIDSPKRLAKEILENPPKGKFAESWVAEADKTRDILVEIFNLYNNNKELKSKQSELENLRTRIEKKYSNELIRLKEESIKISGLSWKRKEPKICLVFPLDGRLTHKLKFSDTVYIEASQSILDDETSFFHPVIKMLNYTKPIGAWVKQDKRGIRAIAYELFTELQTIKIVSQLYGKKPNFHSIVTNKLYSIWIPFIRPNTTFDEEELERILNNAYKNIAKKEFDSMYQMGEIYTELNIILLT
ncbi:MAG: hypothetical protein JXA54_15320 [Candidatus Heimdallarchaeota archaeon]|nr:hypothetical protein [Candidatus Heimdallarchaeota archaeon]